MQKDIFISYSRRDQEFVTRLASDLDRQVAGAWFDQSTIQVGQKWHDEIMDGIRECRAFILVLSPDAAESRYVREEVNKALELGKPIIPVLYRYGKWTGEFADLVKDVQTLDLRAGSYGENFQKSGEIRWQKSTIWPRAFWLKRRSRLSAFRTTARPAATWLTPSSRRTAIRSIL